MSKLRAFVYVVLFVAAAFVVWQYQAIEDSDEPNAAALHRGLPADPESVDPQKARSTQAGDILRDIGEGLLGYSPTGEVLNITAEAIAAATAIELQAGKLILMSEAPDLRDGRRRPIRQLALSAATELLDSRRYQQFEGCGCYVLSPTFRVLNLIMHAEIVDYGYLNGLIPIRALEELAYTVRTDGTAIDWSLLAERFAAVDRLHVLLSFVLFAQRLFGVPLPSVLSHYSFMRPRLHHLRCVLQFESCIADRWIRRWYRLSETHLADRFGTGRSAREIRTKRLKLIAEGLRRRLDRE